MFRDSKQLFDIFTCGKRPMEKRLAIDIAAPKKANKRYDVECVGLVEGENNPADGLSEKKYKGKLMEMLFRETDVTSVEQWVKRTLYGTTSANPVIDLAK